MIFLSPLHPLLRILRNHSLPKTHQSHFILSFFLKDRSKYHIFGVISLVIRVIVVRDGLLLYDLLCFWFSLSFRHDVWFVMKILKFSAWVFTRIYNEAEIFQKDVVSSSFFIDNTTMTDEILERNKAAHSWIRDLMDEPDGEDINLFSKGCEFYRVRIMALIRVFSYRRGSSERRSVLFQV